MDSIRAGGSVDVIALAYANEGTWVERNDDVTPAPGTYVVLASYVRGAHLLGPDAMGARYAHATVERYGQSRTCCPDGRVYVVDTKGATHRFATLAEAVAHARARCGLDSNEGAA